MTARTPLVLVALALAPTSLAQAQVASGELELTVPPISVQQGAVESFSGIVFKEREQLVLTGPIEVDFTEPGQYVGGSAGVDLATTTPLASWLVHFDTPGSNQGDITGSLQFPLPIVPLITRSARLDASDDELGSPTTAYPLPGAEVQRGLGGGGGSKTADVVELLPDRRTLNVLDFNVMVAVDQVRVVAADIPLYQAGPGITAPSGGEVEWFLSAGPANAGNLYLLLGSTDGTSPGFTLDGVDVPLQPTGPWFAQSLTQANQPPFVDNFGVLDDLGSAEARLSLTGPLGASTAGLDLAHAFVAIDPVLGSVVFASNAVGLTVGP